MIDEKKLIEKIEKMFVPLSTPDGSEPIDIRINGYNECLVDVLETIKEQPKVGEWIPIEEREPSCSCTCLTWVKAKTTYSQYEKCVLANYYDGFFDVFPFDVFPYIDDEPNEVQILAWQPLPEPYEVKDND